MSYLRLARSDAGAVFALLASYEPQTVVIPTEPPETVARFELPKSELERLNAELRSATNGRVSVMCLDEEEDETLHGDEEAWETEDDFILDGDDDGYQF